MSNIGKSKAAIEKIRTSVASASEVSLKSLENEGINDKQAERVYQQFCEDQLEVICHDLPKDKAVQLLLDQVQEVTGLNGKELADHVSKKFTDMGSMPPDQRNFSNSMS